ncbi:DUF4426 domain-containing protein [Shewanella sp. 1_MG-2023]|uniref:DUF4426 domain-containing protein n=1 Tax=Shewanella electrodiphila TaxID=934143 RepID=A0ABT0KK49_9GAMM|nr:MULTISPECIES: DUF4426 domain-containing protein [Shewanella]MCC4831131.1 DUF4426 domain-containing protein [Shewanella sp. 10N.7]MCL1044109.1 DUF4426 domain-containing protein [Shewanella electrodiphila]MDO6610093.1 DUF4426 domain-containing protein [Shewanella sp. 7_MG-2023]MDO6769765.1 DUF4426 domain-containing protein [Shewanella sp. 2_MG-2023]MDO6792829.1 DUF4426 domain-containing protein [Shewanella sp. 1_MG-2023]
MFRTIILSLLVVLGLSLGLSNTAQAEQKQQVGNFDIHYMALSSTFITPSIAKTYGIERSNYNGIVNIAVLDTSKEGNPPVAIEISGVANNLLDARITLDFKEIREGKAIYYIAQVPYRDDQEINFNIAIKHGNKLNTALKFKQKFYVE